MGVLVLSQRRPRSPPALMAFEAPCLSFSWREVLRSPRSRVDVCLVLSVPNVCLELPALYYIYMSSLSLIYILLR